jgi:large subunit ribosomal protein L23
VIRIQDIIRRPLITEKSSVQREQMNTLAFEVDVRANKIEIQRAVEKQFKVKVAEVRVARVHGKVRRQGRFAGRRPDWKKAYVRLAPGEKTIDFFEGA